MSKHSTAIDDEFTIEPPAPPGPDLDKMARSASYQHTMSGSEADTYYRQRVHMPRQARNRGYRNDHRAREWD